MKIEKGIPLPSLKGGQGGVGRPHKYPFREMAVGDSFFCDEPVVRVRQAAAKSGERHGLKFSVQSTEGGARVWRIA